MGESLEWLKEQVEAVTFDEKRFRVSVGDGKYIFGAIIGNSTSSDKVDFFKISSIYDTIIDLNEKIKYSFYMSAECNPSENLADHVVFGKPQKSENTAIYFIENLVFRSAILWDMLAQVCNAFWLINKPTDEIYVACFFHDLAQGKKARQFAKDVYQYFKQEEEIRGDMEAWDGNHEYVKKYRDQMTHRNSPNVSTMSSFAIELRPPAIFVLKRATEDYLMAIKFLNIILDEVSSAFVDAELFPNATEVDND